MLMDAPAQMDFFGSDDHLKVVSGTHILGTINFDWWYDDWVAGSTRESICVVH